MNNIKRICAVSTRSLRATPAASTRRKLAARAALRRKRRPWRQPVTRPINRSGWPSGEWDGEPDCARWVHNGIPCMMNRARYSGAWAGYVHVPAGHPWSTDVERMAFRAGGTYLRSEGAGSSDVHGGVTLVDRSEPRGPRYRRTCGLWVGFDCQHSWDHTPGYPDDGDPCGSYRSAGYVRREVQRLADSAIAAATAREKTPPTR